jgi:uncharacterized membrane protein
MAEPSDPRPSPSFAAILRPNRSASVRAINLVIVLLAGVFFLTGIGFALIGAWPVLGFLGLEIVLLYLALRWNLLAAGRHETITLTRRALTIERVDPWSQRTTDTFDPAWAQVLLDRERGKLEIRSHGGGIVVGRFLAPEELAELAHTLRAALAKSRSAVF